MLYIIFNEATSDTISYIIENKMPLIQLWISQASVNEELGTFIECEKSEWFAWDEPSAEKKLRIKLIPVIKEYESKQSIIDINELNQINSFILMGKGGFNLQRLKLHQKTKWFGLTKRIVFWIASEEGPETVLQPRQERALSDFMPIKFQFQKEKSVAQSSLQSQKKDQKDQKDVKMEELLSQTNQKIKLKIVAKFPSFGISVISNFKRKSQELLYLLLKGIEIISVEGVKIREVQFRVATAQADLNFSHDISQPVALATKHQPEKDKDKHWLNILIKEKLNNKQIQIIESFKIEILPFYLQVDENLVMIYFKLFKFWQNAMQSEESKKANQMLFQEQLTRDYFWILNELPPNKSQVFFQEIQIQPLEFYFTVHLKNQQSDLVSMIINIFGSAIANIDEMPIKLEGLQMLQCNENLDLLQQRLVSHYKKAVINNIIYDKLLGIKVLGSLNIIGNPVKLFGNIQQGLVDAIKKPIDGFIQGPLEGGQGIIDGAESLVSKTIEGTFNSLSKISGSIATGLGALTLDKEYLQEREKLRTKRAKHIGQGIKQGGEQLAKGFGSAIVGLIMNPITQAEKGGVTGFFKGVFSGTTGLIIKPVNAILDFTSKTAEGIQNTTVKSKKEEHRQRSIRVFYGPEKFYKHYNSDHAEIFEFLWKFKHGAYKNLAIFDILTLNTLQIDVIQFLIIGCEQIVSVQLQGKKLKRNWEIQVNNIQKVSSSHGGIRGVHIAVKNEKNKMKGIQNNIAFVYAKEDWQIALVISRLEEVVRIKTLEL